MVDLHLPTPTSVDRGVPSLCKITGKVNSMPPKTTWMRTVGPRDQGAEHQIGRHRRALQTTSAHI
jgi:hypothetical protein